MDSSSLPEQKNPLGMNGLVPVKPFKLSHRTTEPNKSPEKTQISPGIRPVWPVFDMHSMGS